MGNEGVRPAVPAGDAERFGQHLIVIRLAVSHDLHIAFGIAIRVDDRLAIFAYGDLRVGECSGRAMT